eukprot:scaffold10166_cov146-Isochrysis_galbana.AAC.5
MVANGHDGALDEPQHCEEHSGHRGGRAVDGGGAAACSAVAERAAGPASSASSSHSQLLSKIGTTHT